MIDQVARRYNQRPSSLLNIDDPWTALDVDLGVMIRGMRQDNVDSERANKPGKGGGKKRQLTLGQFKKEIGKGR